MKKNQIIDIPAIGEIINRQMRERKNVLVREIESFSWGTYEECVNIFSNIFVRVDSSITRYYLLKEYQEVINWMTDTKGKGLLLMGDCGRGKTIIISSVIPVLFGMKNRTLRPFLAQDMNRDLGRVYPNLNPPRALSCLEYLLDCHYPVIDELGSEPLYNDYGEKCEGFNLVINAAERYNRPMFITTNLTEDQILSRYGERTLDRLVHLCLTVKFSGQSLRK